MKPRIGITTSLERDPENGDRQTLRRAYVQAVARAGGLPLVAPMLDDESSTRAFAALLDGLIVTGGPAITDGLVTDEGTPALPDDLDENADARRRSDEWLLDAVEAAGRPVLGICYGMQLVNARRGGHIWADVERQMKGAATHSQKRGAEAHSVRLRPDTHLHRLLESDEVEVNTRHLQALASVGRGLRVSAEAPDGVIEAVESPDGQFVGVQFHPERLGESFAPLFRHLVERARPSALRHSAPSPVPARAQDG